MSVVYMKISGDLEHVYQSVIMVASTLLGILEPEEANLTNRLELNDAKKFHEVEQTQAGRAKFDVDEFHAEKSCRMAESVL